MKSNTPTLRMQLKIKYRDLSVHSANQWKAAHPPWECNSWSNTETYLYPLPISEKQHIHPEDTAWDQMQRLIYMIYQSVKSNTSILRMQLKIKCRDLSVCSAIQWKATHLPWRYNLDQMQRLLYALPISEKQHIHPEDATWDQMQRLICTLC